MKPLIGIIAGVLSEDASGGWDRCDGTPRHYSEAIVAAGGVPVLIPCAEDPEVAEAALAAVSGVLITGGPDVDPARYGRNPIGKLGRISPLRDVTDEVVVRHAMAHPEMPCLGICRGIQAMNVFTGGTLYQDIPSQVQGAIKHSQDAPGWYGTHQIEIEASSRLAAVLRCETICANTFHHQAVDEVGEGFVVVARAADGVIEAIENPDAAFCIGVQFHPEIMFTKSDPAARLFAEFVRACG